MPNPSARVEQQRMMSLWIRGTGPVAMDHRRRDAGDEKKKKTTSDLAWPYVDSFACAPTPKIWTQQLSDELRH
ncbi:hypothetical protein BHE74_00057528 [Ensete ventricosum]|nr:hypothetical protein BHE74_00057528 [Ensete ventricosum]RZS26793.1 hypothetical protein BHM03_00060180 [Ensete ventricosum]